MLVPEGERSERVMLRCVPEDTRIRWGNDVGDLAARRRGRTRRARRAVEIVFI